MNHKALLDQDLAGWKLTTAYLLELNHQVMGSFPAIFAEGDEELFLCLDRELLMEVAKLLPPRRSKITEFKVLANESLGIAFDLGIIKDDRFQKNPSQDTHIAVLTKEKFDQLVAASGKNRIFKWAPGLVSNDMNKEEFLETLATALKKMG